MKKTVALILAASTLLLAGCCTTHHVTSWEYKIVPKAEGSGSEWQKNNEALMNDMGKEGWIFVSESNPYLFFKRPIK
jgi:protein involved in sex pheromone biosynthesis